MFWRAIAPCISLFIGFTFKNLFLFFTILPLNYDDNYFYPYHFCHSTMPIIILPPRYNVKLPRNNFLHIKLWTHKNFRLTLEISQFSHICWQEIKRLSAPTWTNITKNINKNSWSWNKATRRGTFESTQSELFLASESVVDMTSWTRMYTQR